MKRKALPHLTQNLHSQREDHSIQTFFRTRIALVYNTRLAFKNMDIIISSYVRAATELTSDETGSEYRHTGFQSWLLQFQASKVTPLQLSRLLRPLHERRQWEPANPESEELSCAMSRNWKASKWTLTLLASTRLNWTCHWAKMVCSKNETIGKRFSNLYSGLTITEKKVL